MKKLFNNIAVIILAAFVLQACGPVLSWDEDLELSGASKDEIYNKANKWFSDNFSGDAEEVNHKVTENSKEQGSIKAKGSTVYSGWVSAWKFDFTGSYSLGVEIAESRMKILASVDGLYLSVYGIPILLTGKSGKQRILTYVDKKISDLKNLWLAKSQN